MVSLVSGLNGQLARRVVELAYGLEHVRVVHQRMVVLRVPDHVSKQKTAILKHVHVNFLFVEYHRICMSIFYTLLHEIKGEFVINNHFSTGR